MTLDLVTLSSNRFQQVTLSAFTNLLEDVHFNDVTLACKDGQQVKAHKVILASSSPFFKTILIQNHHQHPLIYLKGVEAKDLSGILKFIYSGEVEVEKEEVARFLETANDLEIDGLTVDKDTKLHNKEKAMKEEVVEDVVEAIEVDVDVEDGEYNLEEQPTKGTKVQTPRSPFTCPGCDYSSTFRNNMLRHINGKNHEGEQLVFPTIDKPSLTKPKEKYPCTDCEYSSNFPRNLARHNKSKHSENTSFVKPETDF